MPRVSVLMPVYNSESYLAEAIDSIIGQSYSDWELIIINDGSTDKSDEIILSYTDERIKYSKNTENKGLIYSRNLMIEQSSGEYIAFLDSDDIAVPERLKLQTDFLDQNTDYALCGTWSITIDGTGKTVGKFNMPDKDEDIKCALLFTNTFVQSSLMIRREILANHPYDMDYPLAEDYELWCRLSRLYKLGNIPMHLTKYRWHDSNISKSRKDHLSSLVRKIYKRELSFIGIDASDAELTLHAAISDKSISDIPNKDFLVLLKSWLRKLFKTGLSSGIYDKNSLRATTIFRWIFACKERKIYLKSFSIPVALNIKALGKLTKMIRARL